MACAMQQQMVPQQQMRGAPHPKLQPRSTPETPNKNPKTFTQNHKPQTRNQKSYAPNLKS